MNKDNKNLGNEANITESMSDCENWHKETYIRHIRQELRRYCTANDLARAIGGDFTPEFVVEICGQNTSSIRRKMRKDKLYIERDSFLQHLKENLVMEDNSNFDEDDYY